MIGEHFFKRFMVFASNFSKYINFVQTPRTVEYTSQLPIVTLNVKLPSFYRNILEFNGTGFLTVGRGFRSDFFLLFSISQSSNLFMSVIIGFLALIVLD